MDICHGNVSIALDREAPQARVTIDVVGRDGWTAEHVLDMRGRPRPVGDVEYRYNGRRRIKNVPRFVREEGALTDEVRGQVRDILERLRDERREIREAQIAVVGEFALTAEYAERALVRRPSPRITAPSGETYVWEAATLIHDLDPTDVKAIRKREQSLQDLVGVLERLGDMQEVSLLPMSRAGRPRTITPESIAKARREVERSGARPTDARVAEILGVARESVVRFRSALKASGVKV